MGDPIRVLHVVSIMNRGGLETLIMNIYRKIDRNQIQFDFLVNRREQGVFDEEIKQLGGKIYNVSHIQSVGYIKHRKEVETVLNTYKEYKIIHSHVNTLNGIYLSLAKKCNIPIRISHSHNTSSADPLSMKGICRKIFRQYSKALITNNATNYFACSKVAGEWLYGDKIAQSHLTIINNGVDSETFQYDSKLALKKKREIGINEDSLLLGHVGRFTNQKNHDGLIEIFYEYQKHVDNVKLCLVGDGILREKIEEKINRLGIKEQVVFLGVREDINELMMAFDILLFPSFHEGLPVVLIEAQATGLPCIISDTITREVDLNIGLVEFVSLNDMKRWVDSIKSKIIQKDDSQKKRESTNVEIKRMHYDISETVEFIKQFYEQAYKDNNSSFIEGEQ